MRAELGDKVLGDSGFTVAGRTALQAGPRRAWAASHDVNAMFFIGTSFIVMVWLSIGGLKDLVALPKDLKEAKRNFSDDGTVRDHDFEVKP